MSIRVELSLPSGMLLVKRSLTPEQESRNFALDLPGRRPILIQAPASSPLYTLLLASALQTCSHHLSLTLES